MLVREYIPGDEQKILKLFNVVFGRKLDLRFWNWRFIENPYGKGIIRLMFDDEKLVGHYSAIPQPLWLDGTIIESALLMTAMTHPDYRGMSICTNLAQEVYTACKARGLGIVFGFPNDNIYQLYLDQLDWTGFGHMGYWEKTDLSWNSGDKKGYLIDETSSFDSRFDDLWHRAESDYKVAVPRVSKYLNWRYFAKPGEEYQIYSIEDNEGLLCGYAVLKLFQENGEVTGNIIDALIVDCPQARWSLLAETHDFFSRQGAARITCWFPDNSMISGVLRQAGFERKIWPTYFGARILGLKKENAEFVSESKNWWITMGDSDVF